MSKSNVKSSKKLEEKRKTYEYSKIKLVYLCTLSDLKSQYLAGGYSRHHLYHLVDKTIAYYKVFVVTAIPSRKKGYR